MSARPWTRILWIAALVAALLPLAALAQAAAPAATADPLEEPDPDPWPRAFEAEGYTIAVHPPQVESWNGRSLRAHAAVEIRDQGKQKRVFGAVDFTARTRVDKEARLVVIDELQVVRAQIPAAEQAEGRLLGVLQKHFSDAVRVVALDRLEAAVAITERERAAAPEVRNEAPRIVFAEGPALLVTIDGAPAWRPVAGSAYERLLNTRPLVLKDAEGYFYLRLFDGWLRAPNLAGPWKPAPTLPPGLAEAMRASLAAQPADLLDGGSPGEVDPEGEPVPKPTLAKGPVPEILVADSPTELVVLDGPAKWQGIPGTALEYAENTTGNLFRTGDPKAYYVLVSGRWFSAAQLAGPWSHVPQAKLAEDFRRIPDDSPKENVKASVAGTEQAEEARIANAIPQTAEVKRAEARFEPTVDGEPRLETIPGTTISQVANSPTPILLVEKKFYAVHNGVWFVSPAVAGPWSVADAVPEAIYDIPPSSPVHYVTYVRVYDADETTVVVGYTPGYYGTVDADGVVVCGTGYAYSPWIGASWYGYPATYGYGCGLTYSPWSGWAFSYGVGWAWGYWGGWYGPYYPPYWGAWGGYYPWYGGAVVGPGGGWAAWGPGGWAGTTGNVYRQWGSASSVSRYSGGYNAWTGNAWRSQVGMAYNSRTGTLAAGQRGAVGNIYTGQYAYGGRGVAHSTGSGATVAGGRVTMGDADTGREITAGRVGGYNPATGEAGSAGWVRGDQGGVARAGDDYYAWRDGSVYRREGQGEWSQVDRSGQWKGVQDRARTQDLNRQFQARNTGAQRYQGYRSAAPRPSTGMGGMRGGGGRRR